MALCSHLTESSVPQSALLEISSYLWKRLKRVTERWNRFSFAFGFNPVNRCWDATDTSWSWKVLKFYKTQDNSQMLNPVGSGVGLRVGGVNMYEGEFGALQTSFLFCLHHGSVRSGRSLSVFCFFLIDCLSIVNSSYPPVLDCLLFSLSGERRRRVSLLPSVKLTSSPSWQPHPPHPV